jgi:ABC-type phosphate transport system substrate-binding protein
MKIHLRLCVVPFLLYLGLCWGAPVAAQVIIVANAGVKTSEVSKQDLREIFTGSSSSLKGDSRVTPVLLKGGNISDEMLTTYIGKSDSAFRAGWRSLLFSGEGVMPKTLESEAAVLDYIARTPGTIGYVGKAAVHEGAKLDGVKILGVR